VSRESAAEARPDTFLPLSRPSVTPEDVAAVRAVLESGWLTTGKECARFESAFASRVGCRHAVAVTSATAGMHLLLHALGIGPGDEVVTPSMTWVSTVNLIVLAGAKPVFVDVDRDTLMTDAERIAAAITPRTRLVVPVHFAGAALDLDPIRRLASDRGIHLVEDAAHAAGTAYKGRPIGQAGTAVFSLHPIKNMTSGEGGIVCTDDDELAQRIRRLRFHGLAADAFERETQGRAPQAEVVEPGYKYNLPDINAALGLSQLQRLDDLNTARERLASHYRDRLADVESIAPLDLPAYPFTHAWHLMVVRVDERRAGIDRDGLMAALKSRGIGTGLHFRAVHEHRYYRDNVEAGALPDTEWNSSRLCSLPLFPDMTLGDVGRVVEAIRSITAETRQ
jgi:UDP-4-amino-4-deoxy-L-arabinose-oxoglutarate aminotransferase